VRICPILAITLLPVLPLFVVGGGDTPVITKQHRQKHAKAVSAINALGSHRMVAMQPTNLHNARESLDIELRRRD
jgi:hypothetical protein